MRTLIVYYSLGGTTRKLAEALAKTLSADIAEVRCSRYGRGAVDFLKACYDSLMSRLPEIEVKHASLQTYDLVLVGGPIWAGHVATPIRTYLNSRRGQFKRMAFFSTSGGPASDRSLAEMADIAGATPLATLALRTSDVLEEKYAAAIDAFVRPLKLKAAA